MFKNQKVFGVVYMAVNLINDKKYVGQTVNFYKRKSSHINSKDNRYFHNALRKYGKDVFKWVILCECMTKEELNIRETMKIIVTHSHVSEGGYNLTWGGDDNPMNNEETRKKVGISNTGKIRTEEFKRNLHNIHIGKILSIDTKIKMSKSKKGIIFTDEHIKNIGISSRGRKFSDTAKKNMSNASKGRVVSEETRKKISKSLILRSAKKREDNITKTN